MKKTLILLLIFVCILSSFYFSFYFNFSFAFAENATSAQSMVVIETSQNKILYSKNENQKLPMASTTKIVTAITVIEHAKDLDEIISVPKSATLVEGSSVYLRAGEMLSLRDLLYGLMLRSGNDCAETLALHIGGSLENFANMMNETATNIGALDSHFVTPHGLDDKEHYTTAIDLAKITSYALKNPDFKQIVSTKCHKTTPTETSKSRTFVNKNKLLSSMDGAIGVKTGYTKKSGRCLVSACERDGMQVVCVVLNCGPMFEESAQLIERAFSEYQKFEILPDYKFITDVQVENGTQKSVRVYAKNGFSVVDKEENLSKYEVKYTCENSIKAPVEKGAVVGEIKIFFDNDLIFSENLCSIDRVEKEEKLDELKNILENW